jgi:predicted regulator of amino acid metabolism with ACT domain
MKKFTVENFQEILIKNQKFSEHVINTYPDIEADVRSYRLDPNCSCRHKIAKYFNENRDKIIATLLEWIESTKIVLSLDDDEKARGVLKPTLPTSEWSKYKDVIGEIVEIAPDPNEYKRIISIARAEWLYNGINILETVKFDPQTKQESVVWLLLFY